MVLQNENSKYGIKKKNLLHFSAVLPLFCPTSMPILIGRDAQQLGMEQGDLQGMKEKTPTHFKKETSESFMD